MKFHFCKRLSAVILAVCLCCLLTVPAFASEAENAEISLQVSRDGDTITATVTLVSIHTEIAGCDFFLNFDNSKLEYIEHTSEAFDFGFRDKVDYLYFSGFANDGVSEPGILAVVTFKVLDSASGGADISISNVILGDQEAQQVPVVILTTAESTDNSVTVREEKEGTVVVDLGTDSAEQPSDGTGDSGVTGSDAQEQTPEDGNNGEENQQLDGIQKKKGSLFWLLPAGLVLAAAVIVVVLVAAKKKK